MHDLSTRIVRLDVGTSVGKARHSWIHGSSHAGAPPVQGRAGKCRVALILWEWDLIAGGVYLLEPVPIEILGVVVASRGQQVCIMDDTTAYQYSLVPDIKSGTNKDGRHGLSDSLRVDFSVQVNTVHER